MKRDMELIRKILIEVQNGNLQGQIEGYDDAEVKYHKKLAIENGLLKGSFANDNTSTTVVPAAVLTKDITWEGHDFIDAIEDENRWQQVKSYLAETGKIISLETVKLAVKQLFGAN